MELSGPDVHDRQRAAIDAEGGHDLLQSVVDALVDATDRQFDETRGNLRDQLLEGQRIAHDAFRVACGE